MALIDKITAIAVAIREKTGTEDKLTLDQMATAIAGIETGGEGLQEIVLTGDISYAFGEGRLQSFIDSYKDHLTSKNITKADSVAYNYKGTVFPIDINFDTVNYQTGNATMFKYARTMVETGKITNLVGYVGSMFENCSKLKHANLVTPHAGRIYGERMFYACNALRTIPSEALSKIYISEEAGESYCKYNYTLFSYGFFGCYCLDELVGLYPPDIKLDSTGNAFTNTFTNCEHIKDVIFATQEDGTPYVRNWCRQTLTCAGSAFGYGGSFSYHSGIGSDKRVDSVTKYESLKNDPDWYASSKEYSRFNHDSAVRTINSLPDCSAAIAGDGSNINTISFNKDAGSATDGGAISTLTEEEIAVATAKGWSVVLV